MASQREITAKPANMPPLPQGASSSEKLHYYRTEKLKVWQMAQRVDVLKHREVPGYRCETYQIQVLVAEINQRERVLSPLGHRICEAILELPNPNAQLALELRYFDLLTIQDVAAEMHYTYEGIRSLIYRATKQLHIKDP